MDTGCGYERIDRHDMARAHTLTSTNTHTHTLVCEIQVQLNPAEGSFQLLSGIYAVH